MKYTPILKWRQAEKVAIKELTDEQKGSILPMFEFLQKASDIKKMGRMKAEYHFIDVLSSKIPQDILLSWGDDKPFFADFTLIEPLEVKKEFSSRFMENSLKLHIMPIPVVNISAATTAYASFIINMTVKYSKSKICLRFSKADLFDDESLGKQLTEFKDKWFLASRDISVLIDLREDVDSGYFEKAMYSIGKVSELNKFDNIIIASGAFPEDMRKITDEDNRRPRTDWNNWLKYKTRNYSLSRYPAFADYTIRYPIYYDRLDFFSPSATIKYTLDTQWLFFKGAVAKYIECCASASVFRKDSDFRGRDFSFGDRYIDDKGQHFDEYMSKQKGKLEPGNVAQWLSAGINHHIAVVVDQIANLGD